MHNAFLIFIHFKSNHNEFIKKIFVINIQNLLIRNQFTFSTKTSETENSAKISLQTAAENWGSESQQQLL